MDQYIFMPTIVLSGIWLWKGHMIKEIISAAWNRRL
jgi:hypothetical protein